jgi:hypothetical protein
LLLRVAAVKRSRSTACVALLASDGAAVPALGASSGHLDGMANGKMSQKHGTIVPILRCHIRDLLQRVGDVPLHS